MDVALVLLAAVGAGCVDAIVGGGGLIQTPALFGAFPQQLPATLLGTNKVASICGTSSAVLRYARQVRIPWRALLPLALLVLITSAGGSIVATRMPPQFFRPIVPVLLFAVLIHLLQRKDLGSEHRPREFAGKHHGLAAAWIGLIGFYDGFFGPGTGSFLMFVFVRYYGYDFINAAACARVLNVATNAAALLYFAYDGQVIWRLGLMMAACNVAGALLGTRLAFRGGSRFVRKVFIAVVSALILRTVWTAVR